MSDEPSQTGRTSKSYHVTRSQNSGMKWLAGAAAAAVLVGGGYYAYKNYTPSETAPTEVAETSPTFAGPLEGGESSATQTATAETAVQQGVAPTLLSDETAAAPAPKPKAKARVAAATIPTETIGVSRTGVSQTEDLVVTPSRRPVWARTPRPERLSEFYPASALEWGREGEASLHCTVAEKGALNCVSVSETPARAGFGRAAVQVARTFRHAPQRADGKDAIGTPVNLRVLFRMDDKRRG